MNMAEGKFEFTHTLALLPKGKKAGNSALGISWRDERGARGEVVAGASPGAITVYHPNSEPSRGRLEKRALPPI